MAKKQKCPEFENHERWLVSYADMVTLLFAVFVVLYSQNMQSSSSSDESAVAGSMQESFNTPLEDIPVDRRVGPAENGFGIFKHFSGDQLRPPLVTKYPGSKERIRIIDSEMKRVSSLLEERLYGPNKSPGGKTTGQARIVSVHKNSKGFKLRLVARHFYDSGQTKMKRSALGELDSVVKVLKSLGRPVTIEGYTDSIPPQGEMSNWELSALRATWVLRYMIRNHNFPPRLISAAGFGDQHPIAHNGTEAGRRLNRRIEIQVHYNDDSYAP